MISLALSFTNLVHTCDQFFVHIKIQSCIEYNAMEPPVDSTSSIDGDPIYDAAILIWILDRVSIGFDPFQHYKLQTPNDKSIWLKNNRNFMVDYCIQIKKTVQSYPLLREKDAV
jgi:hypothetical protein